MFSTIGNINFHELELNNEDNCLITAKSTQNKQHLYNFSKQDDNSEDPTKNFLLFARSFAMSDQQ